MSDTITLLGPLAELAAQHGLGAPLGGGGRVVSSEEHGRLRLMAERPERRRAAPRDTTGRVPTQLAAKAARDDRRLRLAIAERMRLEKMAIVKHAVDELYGAQQRYIELLDTSAPPTPR